MSLIFTESFDLYSAAGDMAIKWFDRTTSVTGNGGGGNAALNIVTGRSGGKAIQTLENGGSIGFGQGADAHVGADLGTNYQTLFLGCAVMWNSGTAHPPIRLIDSTNTTIQIALNISGTQPTLERNGTTLCTSATSISTGAWNYFEIACFISSTAGWCELYMNSTLAASYYGTGTSRGTANGNTQGAGNANIRYIRLGTNQGSSDTATQNFEFDDVYVCSSAGSVNNDVLGDCKLIALLPSAQGSNTNWDKNGVAPLATNYTAVNEQVNDGDSTYVSANAVGMEDTYQYVDLPLTATVIRGVVAQYVAKVDSGGSRTLKAVVRQGATEALSPTGITLSSSYQELQLVMEVNPVTGVGWTQSEINSDEFGVKVTA